MGQAELVDPDGRLGALRGGVAPVLIAAIGPRGSAKSSMLNTVFSSRFDESSGRMEQKTFGAKLERLYFSSSDVALVDVEGFDSSDEARYKIQGRAMALSLSVSDVLIFNCHFHDLFRDVVGIFGPLVSCIAQMKKMEKEKVISTMTGKSPLILLVRDFDADDSSDDLVADLISEIPSEVADRYDLQVSLVRSALIQPDEYQQDVVAVREKCQNLVSEASSKLRSKEVIPKVWSKLSQDEKDVPSELELQAAFDCDVAFQKAWKNMEIVVGDWSDSIEGGQIYSDFGATCDEYSESVLSHFEKDVGSSRNSPAFKRKKEELKANMKRNFEDLCARQIRSLSESEFEQFLSHLETIPGGADMGRRVNGLVDAMKKSFENRAKAILPKGTKVRYDSEKKELFQNLKSQADSRLQHAELTGAYQRPKREPIAIGIHYLHPHPFGVDSRAEQLNMNDGVQFDAGRFQTDDIGEPITGPRARRQRRDFERDLNKYLGDVKQ